MERGEYVWAYYNLAQHREAPFPSLGDLFFLGYYPLLMLGVLLFVRARTPGYDRASIIDAAIIAVGVGVVSWVFLIDPYTRDLTLTLLQRLVSIAYPLMDILVLATAARLLLAPGKRPAAFFFLGSALIVTLVTDTVWSALLITESYATGHPVTIGWFVALTCWGVAALHPSMHAVTERAGIWRTRPTVQRLALLIGVSLIAPAALLIQVLRGRISGVPIGIAGSAIVFVLVLLRIVEFVRQSERAADNERIVRQANAALATATDRKGMFLATVEAVGSLLREVPDTACYIAVGSERAMIVTATAGAGAVSIEGTSIDPGAFPDPILARLAAGQSTVVSADGASVGFTPGIAGPPRSIFTVPLIVHDELRGAVVVGSDTALDEDVRRSLQLLAAQLASALGDHTVSGAAQPGARRNPLTCVALALAGVGLSFCFWLIDSFLDAFAFHLGSFTARLHAVDAYELWGRAEAIIVLIGFSVLAQIALNRHHRVAERLAAQAATLRGQAQLLDLAQDAIIVVDLEGGIIRFWSRGAEEMYGWTSDEAMGVSAHALLKTEFPLPPERLRAEVVRTGRWDGELVQTSRDGTTIVMASRWAVQRDQLGKPTAILEISSDITEQTRIEDDLRRAKTEAEAAHRVKADFLANMSHEIRTPLNGILGFSELLLETPLSDEQREYVATVNTSGDTLLRVIGDILDFSKLEAGKLTLERFDFDLAATVEEVGALLATRAHAKGVELITSVAPDVPTALRGDPFRLRQVLTNLVGNAVKFTERGEVLVRIHVTEETVNEAVITVSVRDTGVGLTTEERGRLFQSFTQADNSTTRKYGGTGLGLVISKQLVEMMGGTIDVESEPGRGSTFRFTARFAKQVAVPVDGTAPREDLRGLRVLIVDDNATNRRLLHEQIVAWGIHNGSAADGSEALDLLHAAAARGEAYDLAILDMQMPGMDGLALARAITADPALATVRLVLLTSIGRSGIAEEAREAGIAACLTKPVRQSALHDCLATVMAEGHAPAGDESVRALAPPIAPSAPGEGATILLVEDNAVNQRVAAMMLRKLGYRVAIAGDGRVALDALAERAYAAILMDCQMPEMDGYAATAAIRQREGDGSRTPIIAMTANAMQGDRERCLAAGMDDYLAKPVRAKDLATVLARWVPTDAPGRRGEGAGSETGTVLDSAVLANLRELEQGTDTEIVREVTALFRADTPARLTALRAATDREDAAAIAREAHALKGSFAAIGALEMVAACESLEGMARAHDLAGAAGAVAQLEGAFARVCTMLDRELAAV